ncbi:unnamed protein product [Linum trigynum]
MHGSARCALCQWRKADECPADCHFRPHFPAGSQAFEKIRRVYGGNVVEITYGALPFPEQQARLAFLALEREADARIENPVMGSLGTVAVLEEQIRRLREQLASVEQKLALFQQQVALLRQQHLHPNNNL